MAAVRNAADRECVGAYTFSRRLEAARKRRIKRAVGVESIWFGGHFQPLDKRSLTGILRAVG
jgi:hypothetical protein